MTKHRKPTLDRRKVVADVLKRRGDALVVPGLGAPTWDCAAVDDHPLTFYSWGGMGGCAMMGLGLALAQPRRRVLVITGDGDMLMGLGSLATIAVQSPRNMVVIVLDNEAFGETGMQPTHTRHGVDLPGMAKAAGFRSTGTIYTASQLQSWIPRFYRQPGPVFPPSRSRPGARLWYCRGCATASRSRTASAKPCWATRPMNEA